MYPVELGYRVRGGDGAEPEVPLTPGRPGMAFRMSSSGWFSAPRPSLKRCFGWVICTVLLARHVDFWSFQK